MLVLLVGSLFGSAHAQDDVDRDSAWGSDTGLFEEEKDPELGDTGGDTGWDEDEKEPADTGGVEMVAEYVPWIPTPGDHPPRQVRPRRLRRVRPAFRPGVAR